MVSQTAFDIATLAGVAAMFVGQATNNNLALLGGAALAIGSVLYESSGYAHRFSGF